MNTIDLSPLYRSSVGFDRLASLINRSLVSENSAGGYPPYNIEVINDNQYVITIAVAGFARHELDIQVEQSVLSIRGKKEDKVDRNYLHQGLAYRAFERKFNLADYVEVLDAKLEHGLLSISLKKEVPESMKVKSITISESSD